MPSMEPIDQKKEKALTTAITQIERSYGKGSIMRMGSDVVQRIESIPDAPDSTEGLVTMTMTLDGRTSTVQVDPDGPPLLDYARSVRSEVPFACKGGMCATCKAKVTDGEVTLEKNSALTDDEVAAGFVLTCQSHPVGGDVCLTYDVHGGMGR